MEPAQLLLGKLFHKRVQSEWAGTIEGSRVLPEHHINFSTLKKIQYSSGRGRIDIYIEKMDDFISVIEIKSTDWEQVKKENIKKIAGSHKRQILKYVDKYLADNNVNVCAALLYPKAPASIELKETIEKYFEDFSVQVAWYENQ